MRVTYLGPPGTFSDEALLTQPDLARAEHISCRSVPGVIEAVERGDADLGLVPLENSIEGAVTVSHDLLAFSSDLLIQRELDLPVSLHLCALPGTKLADVRRVASHPNPLEQCRGWLAENLPLADLLPMSSTAEAARSTVEAGDPTFASIGTRRGAELHGLEVLATGIEDHHENETRFVLMGRGIPARTGTDKTSIVCFQREDHPGSLVEILQEFAARGINLMKLDSRPSKKGLGQYCFFIDLSGHVSDDAVADCLEHVAARQADVKFLGSYPVRHVDLALVEPPESGAQSASEWIESLRLQIRSPS